MPCYYTIQREMYRFLLSFNGYNHFVIQRVALTEQYKTILYFAFSKSIVFHHMQFPCSLLCRTFAARAIFTRVVQRNFIFKRRF